MKIGEDYPKIEWQLGGWDLLEPNAFLGDTILFFIAVILAWKIRKQYPRHPFYNNWFWFFVFFGSGLLIGGLGHLFWNYWGLAGKYFSWYMGLFAVYFVEQAMFSIHPKRLIRIQLINASIAKLAVAGIILTAVIIKADLTANMSLGLLVPSVNSILGMIFSLVVLSVYYQKSGLGKFNFFWIAVLLMLPSAFFQFMKINPAQFFDRNDVSHLLIAFSFLLYYQGIRKNKRFNYA